MSSALKVVCAFAALVTGSEALLADDSKDIARMNAGAITLITDGANSQSARYATDLSVLMEGERDLRVLPVMGHGPVEALRDLVYLRGIDASIIPADTVAYMRKQGLIEDIDKKVTYVARLGSSQIHVIARADIASLADLAGKNVNIGVASEPRFVTSSLLFDSLGIAVNPVDGSEADAAGLLKSGKADAIVIVAPQPSAIAEDLARSGGYRLLNVTGNDELNGIYAPAMLNAETYDGLAREGGLTQTLSVSHAVAVFNWKKGTDRYYKLRKFADVLYSGIGDLQTGKWHAAWNDVNLSADLPGWTRYVTADEWLANHKRSPADATSEEEAALKAEFQSYLERTKLGVAPAGVARLKSSALE